MSDREYMTGVMVERLYQRALWGDEHDDETHAPADFARMIRERAESIERTTVTPNGLRSIDETLVEIAALALAAMQANERAHGLTIEHLAELVNRRAEHPDMQGVRGGDDG